VSIEGVTLTEGTSFFAIATASVTAKAIANAISTNTALRDIVVSTHSLGTSPTGIFFTSSTYNTAYMFSFSAGPGISITRTSTISMTPNIAVDVDTIAIQNSGYSSGLPVMVSTQLVNNMPPSLLSIGLHSGSTYFISMVDDGSFRLSPSRVSVSTGGYINISNIGVSNSSFTIIPLPFATIGTSGFKWQASNDGSTWVDFNASSVTSTSLSASSSTLWGFGQPTFRYLKGSYSPSQFGGNNIKAIFYGREE
jgi:hypothetical protein